MVKERRMIKLRQKFEYSREEIIDSENVSFIYKLIKTMETKVLVFSAQENIQFHRFFLNKSFSLFSFHNFNH